MSVSSSMVPPSDSAAPRTAAERNSRGPGALITVLIVPGRVDPDEKLRVVLCGYCLLLQQSPRYLFALFGLLGVVIPFGRGQRDLQGGGSHAGEFTTKGPLARGGRP